MLFTIFPLWGETTTIYTTSQGKDSVNYINEKRNLGKIIKYFHSVHVHKNEEIYGSLEIIRGDLTIEGKVLGDVTVYFGNVYLQDSSYVEGNVKSIGGKVYIEPDAEVTGELIEAGLGYYSSRKHKSHLKEYVKVQREEKQTYPKLKLPFPWVEGDTFFGYNRVDGLILGVVQDPRYEKNSLLIVYGALGYSFRRDQGLYQIGTEKLFFSPDTNRLVIGAEYHFTSTTSDSWKLSKNFNSISTLLMRHDYFHYYHKKGFTIYAHFQHHPFYVKIGYQNDRISPLKQKWVWSFFNQSGTYLDPNITPMYPGNLKGLFGETVLNSLKKKTRVTTIVFNSKINWTVTSSDFNSDYSFNSIFSKSTLALKNNWGDNLFIRFAVGSSEGEFPAFLAYRLGGPGSLRGINVNSISGNRMALLNLDWIIPAKRVTGFNIDDDLHYILFFDSGLAWNVPNDYSYLEGFDYLSLSRLINTGGFGFQFGDEDDLRIEFAFDFSKSNKRPIMYVSYNVHLD